jgi:multiple sugar transport system substrate-binding protein
MKPKNLSLVALSILLAVVLLLSACGGSQEPGDTGTNDTASEGTKNEGRVTIKVMTFFTIDTPEIEESVIASFEADHPDIDIELEMLPFSDYFTKLKTIIAGGDAPDVAAMNFENLQQFASLGALAELDPFIEKDNFDMTQYYETTVGMHQYEGKQYGLPATFSTVPLFINKTLFDEAGVSYPDGTWTWDDLIQAGKKLTQDKDGDGIIDLYGYAAAWWPMYVFLNNASFFTEDGKCALSSPEAVEGLQKMADLTLVEHIAPTRADLATQSDWDMFIAGKLAMFPLGPWGIGPYQDSIQDFEWDVAEHPAMAQKATFLFGNAYSITSESKNKEAAWEFVKFAAGVPGGTIRQLGGYEVSPVKYVAESQFLSALEGKPPANAHLFLDITSYAYTPPGHPMWNEISSAIWAELELALLGEQTVQEAMEKACPQVDVLLEE